MKVHPLNDKTKLGTILQPVSRSGDSFPVTPLTFLIVRNHSRRKRRINLLLDDLTKLSKRLPGRSTTQFGPFNASVVSVQYPRSGMLQFAVVEYSEAGP